MKLQGSYGGDWCFLSSGMRRSVLLCKDTNISEEPVASIVSSGGAGQGLILRVGTYLSADRNNVNQNQISCATFYISAKFSRNSFK